MESKSKLSFMCFSIDINGLSYFNINFFFNKNTSYSGEIREVVTGFLCLLIFVVINKISIVYSEKNII